MKSWLSAVVWLASLAVACGDDAPASGASDTSADAAGDGATGGEVGLDVGAKDSAQPGEDVAGDVPAVESDSAEDGSGSPDAPEPDLPTEVPDTIGGEDRPSNVFVPDDWSSRTDWPLIVELHGYGASGFLQDLVFQLDDRVDSDGFVLLTPDGTMNEIGQRFWNASDYCCDLFGSGVDDVAYITGLIEEAIERLRVDPERVYLLGHSNGGFMSYRMGCERADLITGIGVLAGAMLSDMDECQPSRPVSVLHMHGTADATILYDGSDLGAGHPSAVESVDWWREYNGCDAQETIEPDADYDRLADGDETDRLSWLGCDQGVQVGLWTLEGAVHLPSIGNTYRDDLVERLLAMPPQTP